MDFHVSKTVPITLKMVIESYEKVRKGGKAAGIDEQSWEAFDKDRMNQFYVLWNRMTSGTYFPSAVREVEIPKKDGSKRKLGIPTLCDRIAQGVVKDYMEKRIDHLFNKQSYGYRPLKSGHQALKQVKKNCLQKAWVIDMDIAKFFDTISHELLLKAVEALFEEKWVKMYVKRWLEMKIVNVKGELVERGSTGTPQGGVISPLLANLFLHYAFDKWIEQNYKGILFVRYADDIIVHCDTKEQAEELLTAIKSRLQSVHLNINEKKTKIVYCSDYKRKQKYANVQFDFLGFSFQPRCSLSKFSEGKSYTTYSPQISKGNSQKIRDVINSEINWRNSKLEIEQIAKILNPKIRGWINYYGIFGNRGLRRIINCVDVRLIKWIKHKHKITSIRRAVKMLSAIKESRPLLFTHWPYKEYCNL